MSIEPLESSPTAAAELAPQPLDRPASLGSRIAAELRQDIVFGRLRAGERVSQERLSRHYGTSRMPVRDALLRLAHEGLVAVTSGGHYAVMPLTPQDVEDAFEIEAIVHGRAARRATRSATPADIEALEALYRQMMEAEQRSDLDRVGALHWEFHRQINLLARSPKLQAVTRNVSIGIPRGYFSVLPEWAPRANAAHAEIIAAMRDGDESRAERLVRRLLEDSGADLVRYIRQHRLLEPDGRSA